MIEWTEQDSNNAYDQGWGIFLNDAPANLQLQRIDDPEDREPIFGSDKEAWEFVYKQFLTGDKLAKKALLFLSKTSITEFNLIKNHCESTYSGTLYNPM